jgi:hypothetical protein
MENLNIEIMKNQIIIRIVVDTFTIFISICYF